MRPRTKRVLVLAPLAFLAMMVFLAVGGEVVKQLWNWLLPPLFGWSRLTFWQALGMLALCRILFGGFGMGGSGGSDHRRRRAERWEGMTPEERERFRRGLRGRLFGTPEGESAGD